MILFYCIFSLNSYNILKEKGDIMHYIDVEKMCEDFINGKVEIEDILNKCKLGYFRIVKTIKKYCLNNGILIDDNILYRLEIPISKMYNLLLSGMSCKEIAERYHCSAPTIERRLKEYCELNGLDLPERYNKIYLPMKEIYELKKQGVLYRKIAERYHCSVTTIKLRLKEYCNLNDLDFPENQNLYDKVELPMEEIYELKKQGVLYRKIAERYHCSVTTIERRLKEYCELNGLDLPKNSNSHYKIELPMEEIYELKKQGMTYKEISEMYDCSIPTVISKLKEYCDLNDLDFPKKPNWPDKIDLPMKEIYNLRLKGMSYDKIEKQYGCSTCTVINKLKEYCDLNDLDFPENPNRRDKVELPMEEIYELKKQGMTYEEISKKYNCSPSTVIHKLKEYCDLNSLDLPKKPNRRDKVELPMEEVFNLRLKGMSYEKLAKQYGCGFRTIRNKLVKYEDERNKYLEMLLYDFNQVIDGILNKELRYFYGDGQKERHADGYSFVKNNKNT